MKRMDQAAFLKPQETFDHCIAEIETHLTVLYALLDENSCELFTEGSNLRDLNSLDILFYKDSD